MRLRHYKNANSIIDSSRYIIKEPKKYIGKYKTLFKNNNPIKIEIGMGKGNFIIENAKTYPNINFIGIEKFDSVLARSLVKLDTINLPNLKIIRMDANEINEVFNKEIDTIYLNFSDPWPKKRHEKRRLTHSSFLNKYDTIFKDKKHIIFKTDNRKLFEFSVIEFTNYNYKIKEISLDLYNDNIKDNIPTEYEIKFHNKGFPIYKIEVEK